MRHRPLLWYLTTAASIAVGIVPLLVLEKWYGVPRKISVGYGILAYIIGTTAIKLPVHAFVVERQLRPRLSYGRLAVVQGLFSAVAELGAAAAFFVFVVPKLTFWQLIGFGAGAGATEAVMIPFMRNPFRGTSLEDHAADVFAASAESPVIQWLGVLERVWASLLQIGSRGLVYLTIVSGNPIPALIGVTGFAVVDGVAYYWYLRKWRFDTLPILGRVHAYLASAACAMIFAFLWLSKFD